MPKGTVKGLGAQRGCGFVVSNDGDADTLVRVSSFGGLNEGQPLECDLKRDEGRRAHAVNLRPVD